MKKIGVLFLLITLSTLLAGIYGGLHDQITYSISPEYFTVFKFEQFGFLEWGKQSPRSTTALIGFLATWWVGLFIGIFQACVGLIHRTYRTMFYTGITAIFLTLAVAFLFGIIGGIVGIMETSDGVFECCFPYEISERKNFKIVGTIHNYGYMGGEIGCIVGLAYQIWKKRAVA